MKKVGTQKKRLKSPEQGGNYSHSLDVFVPDTAPPVFVIIIALFPSAGSFNSVREHLLLRDKDILY